MIRPEARAALWRWREVIAAVGLGGLGLWLVVLGGWLLIPFGLLVAGLGAVLAVQGLRRLRFGRGVEAPGFVEVDEAQVGYLGPAFGGYVSLAELVELRLVSVQGRRAWRLRQGDGQMLMIPVAATGAERLFDAFATLPGMDTQALVAALDGDDDNRVIWRKAGRLALT